MDDWLIHKMTAVMWHGPSLIKVLRHGNKSDPLSFKTIWIVLAEAELNRSWHIGIFPTNSGRRSIFDEFRFVVQPGFGNPNDRIPHVSHFGGVAIPVFNSFHRLVYVSMLMSAGSKIRALIWIAHGHAVSSDVTQMLLFHHGSERLHTVTPPVRVG